jgi:hypothetical protein
MGKPVMQYAVTFEISSVRRTINVSIPDVSEETNKTRAITGAIMVLDAEGITIWSLLSCNKATS